MACPECNSGNVTYDVPMYIGFIINEEGEPEVLDDAKDIIRNIYDDLENYPQRVTCQCQDCGHEWKMGGEET